jgi:hypothetical protein
MRQKYLCKNLWVKDLEGRELIFEGGLLSKQYGNTSTSIFNYWHSYYSLQHIIYMDITEAFMDCQWPLQLHTQMELP